MISVARCLEQRVALRYVTVRVALVGTPTHRWGGGVLAVQVGNVPEDAVVRSSRDGIASSVAQFSFPQRFVEAYAAEVRCCVLMRMTMIGAHGTIGGVASLCSALVCMCTRTLTQACARVRVSHRVR